ncbi:unnamed protein product, partial [Prorocentrum cordatum]
EVAAVHPRGAAQVSDAHRPYHHRRQRVHAAADPLGLAAERLSGERVRVHQERDDRGRGATRPGEQREGLLHGRGSPRDAYSAVMTTPGPDVTQGPERCAPFPSAGSVQRQPRVCQPSSAAWPAPREEALPAPTRAFPPPGSSRPGRSGRRVRQEAHG